MSNKTATLVKSNLPGYKGLAHLYRLDPPAQADVKPIPYVVVSASYARFCGPETYIFEADAEGNVLDWISEMEGSYRGGYDHAHALNLAGYEVVENEEPELAEN